LLPENIRLAWPDDRSFALSPRHVFGPARSLFREAVIVIEQGG
jgi:hypothetical protein